MGMKLRGKILVLAVMWIFAACSKNRPSKWPQGEEEAIFEKSYVSTAQISLSTGDLSSQRGGSREMHAVAQVGAAPVVGVGGADRLQSLFKDLSVSAQSSGQLVRFELSRKYVTAFKVVSKESAGSLSVLESQIAQGRGDDLWVPLFQVPVQAYGVVEKVKNELNEDTNTLRLRETDAERATHLKFSTLATSRLPVGIPPDDSIEPKQIFVRSRIDGNLLSRDEIEKILNFRVSQEGLYYVRHIGEKLLLFKVRILSQLEKDLSNEVKRQDLTGEKREDLFRCGVELLALVPENLKDGCVAQLAYDVEARTVVAKRKSEDTLGSLGPVVVFEPGQPADGQDSLIKIVYRAKPRESRIEYLDRGSLLAVDELKGAEFLMRRTLQDSPNTFSYTFAGTSGRLEIVRFNFEPTKVRVMRVDPLLVGQGSSVNDSETLMSFPAEYVRLANTDEEGNISTSPRPVPARFDERGALARIDWTQNAIPEISSPLEYFQLGICFDGATERIVSDVDARLASAQGGMLNFSLVSTYVASRSIDCVGVYSEDYFDNVQKNYSFKERISFKRYQKSDEKPLLDLPYEAQKRLGFGLFTYSKKQADSSGRTDVDGAETPLPAIFDLRKGQKITYVLAGLPHESDEKSQRIRATIIRQTERVIKDINLAFRKSFAKTDMADRGDVLELQVEGEPETMGRLGDLDRNYIYYISKATESGVIGLGGAHHNPRSGAVESASVYLYGGNMMGMVEDLREIAKARKLYQDRVLGVSAPVEEAALTTVAAVGAGRGEMPAAAGRRAAATGLDQKLRASLRKPGFERSLKNLAARLPQRSTAPKFSNEELRGAGAHVAKPSLNFRAQLDEAIAHDAFHNEDKLARIFSGRKLPNVLEKMRDSQLCVYQVSAMELLEAAQDSYLEERDNIELLGEAWASTLSHEIGHNLGLRHNFEASFDKANWKFASDESSERNYSSVMDYISDDLIRYDGMGPQDVSALRAAYAGMLEKADGSFMKLSELLPALGKSSWLNVGEQDLARLPLKKFKFCSDEDAGTRPTCNRFDLGATPSEIVQNAVQSYRELYTLRNFANNKLRFSIFSTGNYVGRLFAKFTPIRQNLEETFFQLILSGKVEDYQPFLQATVDGLLFFNDVVRSPDANALALDEERFTKVKFGEAEHVVERKVLRDLRLDSQSMRLKAIGTEWDKAVALILLTERNMGFSRYEDISLRVAYPDIEKFLVEDPSNPLSLPTLGLLAEVLGDNIQPILSTTKGERLALPAEFKSEATELIRFIALDGATFRLDVDGTEASDNNSSFFRVLSGFSSPAGVPAISQPGSLNDLRYWALGRAGVAENLVNQTSTLAQVNALNNAKFKEQVQAYFAATDATVQAELEATLDKSLEQLPESAGPRKISEIRPYLEELMGVASELQPYVGNPRVDPRSLQLVISEQADRFANFAKSAPTVGMGLSALDGAVLGLPLVDELKSERTLPSFEGTSFRNIETLSSFFLLAHPNYRQ